MGLSAYASFQYQGYWLINGLEGSSVAGDHANGVGNSTNSGEDSRNHERRMKRELAERITMREELVVRYVLLFNP